MSQPNSPGPVTRGIAAQLQAQGQQAHGHQAHAAGAAAVNQVVLNADDFAALFRRGVGSNRKLPPLEDVDPAKWQVWKQNFEVIMEINQWDDRRARMEAFASMVGDARRAVADVQIHNCRDIDHMLQQFQDRMVPVAAGKWARAEFNTALQLPSESALQWHTRLRELFMRAYPNIRVENAAAIIDRFCVGLSDPSVREKVAHLAPDTYTDALNLAQSTIATTLLLREQAQLSAALKARPRADYYHFKGNINAMGGEEEAVHELAEGLHQMQIGARGGARGGGATAGNCFCCEQPGHFMRDCPIYIKYGEMFNRLQKKKNERKGKKGPKKNKKGKFNNGVNAVGGNASTEESAEN